MQTRVEKRKKVPEASSLWEPQKVRRLLNILKNFAPNPTEHKYSTQFSCDLPVEILGLIFTYCHPFELLLSLVCKYWRETWREDPVVGLSNPTYVVSCAQDFSNLVFKTESLRHNKLLKIQHMHNKALKETDEKEKMNLLDCWTQALDEFHKTIGVRADRQKMLMRLARSPYYIDRWEAAALTGNVHVLSFLKQNHIDLSEKTTGHTYTLICDLASDGSPKLDLSKQHGNVLLNAVYSGSVQAVLWLVNHTHESFDQRSTQCATEMKRWDLLEVLSEHGAPCNADTTAAVAKAGNLELLKKLREGPNPAHWDYRVCSLAYANGHTAVGLWAQENGCPCMTTYSQ